MKITSTNKGKTATVEASDSVFGLDWKPELVKEVIVALQSNRRANTAQSKDRAAVRGADTKPWRQKGTGRARHGSIYSPIWRGGGVTFGPSTDRNYTKKVNRKTRNTALKSALSYLATNGNLSIASGIELSGPKTKDAAQWLSAELDSLGKSDLLKKTGHAVLIVTDNPTTDLKKSFHNLATIQVISTADLNVEDVMLPRHVIILDEASLKALEGRLV
jgi:large subunit ribosomal protein L4